MLLHGDVRKWSRNELGGVALQARWRRQWRHCLRRGRRLLKSGPCPLIMPRGVAVVAAGVAVAAAAPNRERTCAVVE